MLLRKFVVVVLMSVAAMTVHAQEARRPGSDSEQGATLSESDLNHIADLIKAADAAYASNPANARQLETRAFDYVRQRYGDNSAHMARLHFMLARNHTAQLRFRDAEQSWRSYVDLTTELNPSDPYKKGRAILLLARFYETSRQLDRAEEYLKRALSVLAPLRQTDRDGGAATYASGANSLANLLLARGDIPQAERYLDESISIRSRLFGANSSAVAQSLSIRAKIREEQGQLREAETIWRAVLPARASAGLHSAAELNRALAWNLALQGRFREAEPFGKKAVENYRQLQSTMFGNLTVWSAYAGEQYGIILANMGRDAEAAVALKASCGGLGAAAVQLDREDDEFGSGARRNAASCSANLAMTFSRLSEKLSASGQGAQADATMDEAFLAAQVAASSAANVALTRAGARLTGIEASARPAVEDYEQAVNQKRALLTQPAASQAERARIADQIGSLDQRIAALSGEIGRRAPRYWELRYPTPITRAALQARAGPDAKLLRDNEALVLWLSTPVASTGLVAIITKSSFTTGPISMTPAQLAREVEELRKEIDPFAYGLPAAAADADTRRFSTGRAYRLYRALIGAPEFQTVLQSAGIDTLIVVPSGPLTALPPGVLVTRPGPEVAQGGPQLRAASWLIREKAIAVIPSVSALRTLRQSSDAPALESRDLSGSAVQIFANPDFGQSEGSASARGRRRAPLMREVMRGGRIDPEIFSRLPSLPGSQIESNLLVKTLHGSSNSIVTGSAASEDELWRRNQDGRLERARLISFATHGLIAGDANGLSEPALAFAKPQPGSQNDGILTATEASALRLNADWVLLSACNTASPDGPEADGLSGLVRAFFHAGARTILVSHWRVNDQATAALMVGTLSRYAATASLSKAKALQQSMVSILDSRGVDGSYEMAHPSFWGPFVLVGRPD